MYDATVENPIEGYPTMPYGLVIFSNEWECYFINSWDETKATSPVWCCLGEEGYELCYCSITSLMMAIAECHETNAYSVNSHGDLEEDREKSRLIFRKYNPGIEF